MGLFADGSKGTADSGQGPPTLPAPQMLFCTEQHGSQKTFVGAIIVFQKFVY